MKEIFLKLQDFWNRLPKTVKVAFYIFGAGALDQLSKELTADTFAFVPVALRLSFFNLLEVLLVEGVKYLRLKAKK